MATERIRIIVSEKGSRVAGKNIRGLGTDAKQADKFVKNLKRSLATLGGAVIIQRILATADAVNQLNNRLRVVSSSSAVASRTFDLLIDSANRSRTSIASNVDLYSRLALATEELGTSQKDLLTITELINKSVVASGVGAQEAAAGIIQLAQGLASGQLRGEEFRSVSEQLIGVMQVLRKETGKTTGELREMAFAGELTAELVSNAFLNQQKFVEEQFGKTVSTLSQQFTRLRNETVRLIGGLDAGLGVTATLSTVIGALAKNIGLLTKVIIISTAAWVAFRAVPVVVSIAKRIAAFKAEAAAIRSGLAVRIESTIADELKARATLAAAAADLVAARAAVTRTTAIRAQLASIGQLAAVSEVQTAVNAELAASQLAVITATEASIVAQERLIVTMRANNGAVATASRRLPVFTLATGRAAGAVRTLTKAISAARLGIFGAGIGAVVAGLFIFRNEIKLTSDSTATFGDFLRVAARRADILTEALDSMTKGFNKLRKVIPGLNADFADLIRTMALAIDVLLLGFGPATFRGLEAALRDGGKNAVSAFVEGFRDGLRSGPAQNLVNDIIEQTLKEEEMKRLLERVREIFLKVSDLASKAAAGKPVSPFDTVIAGLRTEIALTREVLPLRQNAIDTQKIVNDLLKETEEVTQSQKSEISSLLFVLADEERAMEIRDEIWQRQIGTALDFVASQKAITDATADGILTLRENIRFTDEARLASLRFKTDAASGFKRAIAGINLDLQDLGAQIEANVVDAFIGAEDALVQFVTTGKLSFTSLIDSIIADLARLAIRQAVLGRILSVASTALGFGTPSDAGRSSLTLTPAHASTGTNLHTTAGGGSTGGLATSAVIREASALAASGAPAEGPIIVPTVRDSGGGAPTIVFAPEVNVTVTGGGSGDGGEQADAAALAEEISDAINRELEAKFMDLAVRESRPGGMFNPAGRSF